jgi:serine/threonine protein phosphatase PrpC
VNPTAAIPQSNALPISVGAVTEIGQREQNQDCMSAFLSPFGAVYLIADGMGGYQGGAEAAHLVAEAVNRHLLAAPRSLPPQDAITLAVRLANVEILEKSKSGSPDFAGMGSTVVLALVQETGRSLELTTAHIGDSRAYLYRDGKLTLLTKDHTQVQWLIDTNAIDEASARNHPDASVLTRALGHTTDLQVDISVAVPLLEGDGILLCSDGLSGFATAETIAATIEGNPDPNQCASQLAQLALDSGSNDNITVQFLRVGPQPDSAAKSSAETRKPFPPVRGSRTRLIAVVSALAFLVLGLGAGIAWWLHLRGSGKQTVDPDVRQLSADVEKLNTDTLKLHNQALEARAEVDTEKAKLPAKTDGKSAKLQSRLKILNATLARLGGSFETIWGQTNTILQAKKDYDTQLGQLRKGAGSSPASAQRQQILSQLKKNVPASQAALTAAQGKFGSSRDELTAAEKESVQLSKDWNGPPGATTKPVTAKPVTDKSKTPPAQEKTDKPPEN